jgi:hypothetical protein
MISRIRLRPVANRAADSAPNSARTTSPISVSRNLANEFYRHRHPPAIGTAGFSGSASKARFCKTSTRFEFSSWTTHRLTRQARLGGRTRQGEQAGGVSAPRQSTRVTSPLTTRESNGPAAITCCFLSADDYLLPGALGRAIELLDDHADVGLCYGQAIALQATAVARTCKSASTGQRALHPVDRRGIHQALRGRRWRKNFVPTPTAVVRTSLLKRLGGYLPQLAA